MGLKEAFGKIFLAHHNFFEKKIRLAEEPYYCILQIAKQSTSEHPLKLLPRLYFPKK